MDKIQININNSLCNNFQIKTNNFINKTNSFLYNNFKTNNNNNNKMYLKVVINLNE